MEIKEELLNQIIEASDPNEVKSILSSSGFDIEDESAKTIYHYVQENAVEEISDEDLEAVSGGSSKSVKCNKKCKGLKSCLIQCMGSRPVGE